MTRTRRTVWVAVTAALAVGVLAFLIAGRGTDETDDGTVSGELQMLDGGTGRFEDYRGKPLVVNFFASWCAPCLAEMPAFEQVNQNLDGTVAFLGVNLQDSVAAGRDIVERTEVSYDIARDPDGTLFADFGGTSMPTTILVDAQGRVIERISGEISGDALAAKIDDELLE